MEQRSRFASASKTLMELPGGTGPIRLRLIVVRAASWNGRPISYSIELLGHGYRL